MQEGRAMTTYKLSTEYQRDTLKKIFDWTESAQLGDTEFFWADAGERSGIQVVCLTDDQVAIRNVGSFRTAWCCINASRGLMYRYTTLCVGVVEE